MSDQIPFHIQEEIMKRLPVKSLLQFRSVSKPWKSLIDTSEFIAAHSLRRHKQPQHLLVSYGIPLEDEYVLLSRCYIDDDTFPKQSYSPTLPLSVQQLTIQMVLGSSQGLFGLLGSHPDFPNRMVVLWNPMIRKSVVVVDVPGEPSVDYGLCPFSIDPIGHTVGFGVCPSTSDPKIVAITRSSGVMIYTLSSGKWRNLTIFPSSTDLPTERIPRLFCTVTTDRFIYWDVQSRGLKRIMSFDLTSESFDMIDLPDSLARHEYWVSPVSKIRDSLTLFEYGDGINASTLWIMEHGAQITFTKLFTITTRPHDYIVGFRKNGIPIMQVAGDNFEGMDKLVVYQPNSEHNNVLEIREACYHYRVYSYMETLLLLGRSDYCS